MEADFICKNVYRVATRVRDKQVFEGIWPLPNGVMLNSYLVKGSEKVALIDFVEEWMYVEDQMNNQMKGLDLNLDKIDYLIINHMEPDHTGALKNFVDKYPNLQIITSKRSLKMLKTFYNLENNIITVKNGEEISLGDKTLVFYDTPNVHWPETIMTYLKEDKVLFSCDAFGSYGIFEGSYDDELTENDKKIIDSETERYYSNIISTFSSFVTKAITKLKDVDISVIAPSHGVVYRKNPKKIIDHYLKLASYSDVANTEKEITLIWSSMYGHTQEMLSVIRDEVKKANIKLYEFRVPDTHSSFIIEKAWRSKGLIVGMPTYEFKMFPPMFHTLDMLERSHINNRLLVRFGSFGWSKGAEKELLPYVERMKLDYVGQTEYPGSFTKDDEEKLRSQIKEMISKF